jgi:hypothetical protein
MITVSEKVFNTIKIKNIKIMKKDPLNKKVAESYF